MTKKALKPKKKYDGLSSYQKKGRTGKRYRVQINRRRYEKTFWGNKESREMQFLAWREQLTAAQKNRSADGSKTWDFFVDKFLNTLRTLKDKRTGRLMYRPRTINEYQYALEHFQKVIKLRYMNDLQFNMIGDFRRISSEAAQQNGDDFNGVNKDMGCLIRAFEWGQVNGMVPLMNLEPFKKPLKVSRVIVSVLQPWQVALLIKYSNLKMRVAVKMGFYTGFRDEEVYNSLIEKLNIKTGEYWVEEHKEDKQRGITYRMPKADKERPVFFPPDLVRDIVELNPKTYIITDKNGNPYTDKNFSNAFKNNLKHVNKMIRKYEKDIPEIACTFKIMRKTHITYMIESGAAEKDASLYAGHADTQVTEEHYIDAKTLKKKERAEKMKQMQKVKKYVLRLPKLLKK